MKLTCYLVLKIFLSIGTSTLALADEADGRLKQSLAMTTAAAAPGVVYTANETDASVSRIDLVSGEVSTFQTEIAPHNLQTTPDGSLLLVVGSRVGKSAGHDHEIEHGLLLVFATDRFRAHPVATIEVGRHPAHVIADLAGQRAFVTNSEDNSISVIDIKTRALITTIATGSFPHGLRPSPDGTEIYVANVKDGSISVVDTTMLREVARIPIGRAPVQVGFSPDGRHAYVSLRDENSVAVLDTATRQVIAKVPVGRGPIQVYATPDGGFVYVANQGTDDAPDSTVSVINAATATVVATIETGLGAHGVVVSPDGQQVFVTNILANTVSVIDTASRRVVGEFNVGDGPNGITFETIFE